MRVERNCPQVERLADMNEPAFSQQILMCVRVAPALARGAAQALSGPGAPATQRPEVRSAPLDIPQGW